jgi:nitrate/nitrite transport system substrate-binding protein
MSSSSSSPSRTVRLGFVSLSDCAPLVVACKLGLGRRYGLELELQRQPSWAAIRDKLLSGELDAAQALYGMVYGVQLGIGGPQADMAILLTLNQNGQAITLSSALHAQLAAGATLAGIVRARPRPLVLAHTFPTGTHAMWLYYWLACQGIDPLNEVRCVVIPPPQMVGALAEGALDGFSAGQPWHAVAHARGLGAIEAHSSEIWPGHPEKVLACRRSLVESQPQLAQQLCAIMLEACRWLADPAHREQAAYWLSAEEYLGLPAALINAQWQGAAIHAAGYALEIDFYDDGRVNYPYLSDGLWFLTQFLRWGMVRDDADLQDLVRDVNQTAIYRAAARSLDIPLPASAWRDSVLMDGTPWHGDAPERYAQSFAIRARQP